MLLRKRCAKPCGSLLKASPYHQRRYRNSVRMKRLQPTKATPFAQNGGIVKKSRQQFLVISLQRQIRHRKGIVRQALEDAARIRPTVDVVPQCNRQWLRCGGALEVGINLADQLIQEIQATMDV